MSITKIAVFLLVVAVAAVSGYVLATAQSEAGTASPTPDDEKLVILWTSGDRDVALKMVFMYAYNAPKYEWWKDVTLIVWGPSAKLLSEDEELQEYVRNMAGEGIHLKACKACADMYAVSDKLTELGVEVKYMGGELTEYIKGKQHVLTL